VRIALPGGRGGVPPAWLPSLPVASAIVAAVLLLVWDAAGYAHALAITGARGTDFAQYYSAARLTLAEGWTAPYDIARYMAALHAITGQHDAYANLPLPTVLVMPLAMLPLPLAYGLWNVLMVGGFAVACWAVAPGRGWARVAQLLASLAAFQALNAIALGQLALAVGALLVLHWWLLRRDRPVLAGIALGLAFVKPQNVALVPAALLLAGRWRAATASAVTAALLGGACLLALGTDGLRAYQRAVAFEVGAMPAGHFTATAALGGVLPALALAGVAVVAVLLVAIDRRDREPERLLAAAVLGSHLVTPYLNGADLALLAPCAWLTLRTGAARWVVGVALAANFVPAVIQRGDERVVAVIAQLVWLAALAAPSVPAVPAAGAAMARALAAVRRRPSEE
jgi:hypothetical protein